MQRDPEILAEVKSILAMIAELAPGKSVELRIPPYAAIQCVEGLRHTRGTPPNVVEMDAESLILLARGNSTWSELSMAGAIHASGERSDLSEIFSSLANRMRS